jgi:hypothetical protein
MLCDPHHITLLPFRSLSLEAQPHSLC